MNCALGASEEVVQAATPLAVLPLPIRPQKTGNLAYHR